MATVSKSLDESGNTILDVKLDSDESTFTMNTRDTYVDKNIIVNIPLDLKADIDSPNFTGTPTAPTPSRSDRTSALATTEYVQNEFDRVVKWDNAEAGTTIQVTTNMVVLTEDEYNALPVKVPNTFYFLYDDLGEVDNYDIS